MKSDMKRYLTLLLAAVLTVSCGVLKADKAPKTVVIIGDSYSTFEGYIPNGYADWYTLRGRSDNNVRTVEQTWWYQLCTEKGLKLIANNSFSGSTVCNTGYDGVDYTHESFVTRMSQTLHYSSDGFNQPCEEKNAPDILFIFGGTNDSWANSPIGEPKYSDWTNEDLYSFLPAFCCLLDYYKREAPSTRVIVMINDGLKPEMMTGMAEISSHFGYEYIQYDGIEEGAGHPTILGMKQIADAIRKML